LRYILRFWIWYVQDLLAEFYHRESAEQTKGPLLWNGYASLRRRRRSLTGSSCSPDYPCHNDNIMLANDAFVRRVEWWKKGDWPYHETLVFYVQERHQSDGKTPRKSVFLAERNITGNTDHPERNIGEPLLINFYEDAGGTVLTTSPPPEPQVQGRLLSVVDTVTHPMGVFTRAGKASDYTGGDMMTFSADGTNAFIHSMPEEKFLCRTLTIHGEYLSVPEVAVLIRVVHDYHRSDKFKVYQSFWFAHTIYTSIQTIIQDSARNMALATSIKQSRSRVFKDETRHTKLKVGQFQQGTKKYYVKQGGPDLPSKVYAEYLAAWDDMKKQIATRINDIEEEFREVSI
jgi:hypothetical protein